MNENIFLDIDDNINDNKNNMDNLNTSNSNDANILSEELNKIMNELENNNVKETNDKFFHYHNENISKLVEYTFNYKIKDLNLICEYYNILKEVKQNKYNKEQIINKIIEFENDIDNSEIVYKRMNMWFYINELKNDKFMKKFILF
jgi:hypothetical protein